MRCDVVSECSASVLARKEGGRAPEHVRRAPFRFGLLASGLREIAWVTMQRDVTNWQARVHHPPPPTPARLYDALRNLRRIAPRTRRVAKERQRV